MPQPTVLTSCPSCGAELQPFAGPPDATPWLCGPCHRGFWTAELSPLARELYRVRHHDRGHTAEARQIAEQVEVEREAARVRGTSALHEHLPMLSDDHLTFLSSLSLHEEFAKHVENARKDRE